MNSDQRIRARRIYLLYALAGFFLLGSLYWIQIVNGHVYATKAESQYQRPAATFFDRGTIYFESKDGTRSAAAALRTGYTAYMNPLLIKNAEEEFDAASQYIDIKKEDFLAKAAKTNDRYEILKEGVDTDTAQSIKSLSLPGVGVVPTAWRAYPAGKLSAHTVGLIGQDKDSTALAGRYGLERYYENVLARTGTGERVNAFVQLFSGIKDTVFGSAGSSEGDVVTSIDPTTERYLEKTLEKTMGVWKADEIGGIIMDPNDGRIIAMASLPTFDPNDTSTVKDISVFSNPLVEHVYEMGSIMKPLTMAVALDTGAEKPDSTYDDTGTMELSGKKISNYDGKARGVIPMQEILSQSLNVGAATIALKVGKDLFTGYFMNFGLGEKTGIDLPSEAGSLMGNLKTGRDVEIATAAYGQGIAVSPINIARALSVLANGGYVVTPRVAKAIDHLSGDLEQVEGKRRGPVLSKDTTEEVTRMLVKVVDEKMAKAHPDIHFTNYSIAAKTGTAQMADPTSKGYYSDRYLHSFFGYFPAYNPKFIVFLYQVYPKGAQYASETLTDPFSDLAKFLIDYYNVPPDR